MKNNPSQPIPVSNKLGGLICMFIALVILGFAGFQIFRIWQFGSKARHASATIDQRYIDREPRQKWHLTMHYHYVVNGTLCAATADVSPDTYGRFHVGDTVPIVFLPNAPSDSRLDLAAETQQSWNNVWLLSLIGFPVFLFAAFIYRLPPASTHA